MITQLNPTIPLRSDKASGECIAIIDYSIEHDLMFVIIDDDTGQIWTVPNRDVRAYANYSAGRNIKPKSMSEIYRDLYPPKPADDSHDVLLAFARQWIAQPGPTQHLLAACLDEAQLVGALRMIASSKPGSMPEGPSSWMPDMMAEAAP